MSNSIFNSIPHVVQGWQAIINRWDKPRQLSNKPVDICCLYSLKAISVTAVIICALATPALTIVDFIYTRMQRKFYVANKDGGCDKLFSSQLILEYKNKLVSHFHTTLDLFPEIKNELQKDTHSFLVTSLISFINVLETDSCKLSSLKERKAWFKEMMLSFRELTQSVDNSKEEIALQIRSCLENWIYERYLEIDLLESLETLLAPYTSEINLNNLPEVYKSMKQDKALRSHGAVLDLFDAHSFGNVPFALPSIMLQGNQSIDMIRMPSVTKDLNKNYFTQSTNEVAIIEEFQWFLNSLATKNKSHLYVNLMDRTHGNEAIRSQTIENLDQKAAAPIHVITLDKDSDFYMQSGQFSSEMIKFDTFKSNFLGRILNPNGRFYLPQGTSPELIGNIIDYIYQEHFLNTPELNRSERQNFIELVYCRLIETVAMAHNVSSMNISCKHCIDRGASQNFIFLHYMRSQDKAKISDKELTTLLFSPAIVVANRPIRQHYMKRAHLMYQQFPKDLS